MRLTENFEITVKGLTPRPKHFRVSRTRKDEMRALLRRLEEYDDEAFVPAEEVFPDLNDPVLGPARCLKGARYREELTQKELAKRLGIKQHHLSEMENAKRPIGKAMAKRLAKELRVGYRIFL